MTTFVILAAGRGSRIGRVGESLHKCLVPLEGRAVLSHQLDLAPPGAKIVICVGHRAGQVADYVQLAHPQRRVTFVQVPDWDQPGAGPGHSLMKAVPEVEGDLVFAPCDTLWERDHDLWKGSDSWAAVAPVPYGTLPTRWCRLDVDEHDRVRQVLDKRPGAPQALSYVGLARVAERDLATFVRGVLGSSLVDNERQIAGGFQALLPSGLNARHVRWTDVGDATSYRQAVARRSGYDFTKIDEATYVLPNEGRVVKFWANDRSASKRFDRGHALQGVVPPKLEQHGPHWLSYEYVPAVTMYQAAEVHGPDLTRELLGWTSCELSTTVTVPEVVVQEACDFFYRRKSYARVARLSAELRPRALDALDSIDFGALCERCVPGIWHGDLAYCNVLVTPDRQFVAIDWREDFAGQVWGDLRYDRAKMLVSTVVHWDNAARGDFRPWDEGRVHADIIRCDIDHGLDVEIIGALSLLNSAPLHAAPLDEILVARGCAWLEEVL